MNYKENVDHILWHMEENERSGADFAFYVYLDARDYENYPQKTLDKLVKEGFLKVKVHTLSRLMTYYIGD